MKGMNNKNNAINGIILVFAIVMITQIFLVLAQDATPPQYSLNSTNSTGAGKGIEFRLNWTDDIGLSGYIFSLCKGTCNYSSDEWWNSSFLYRKSHNITGSTAGNQTNYQMNITVINGTGTDSGTTVYINKTRSDFGDIRFTWYNDTNETEQEIDYWNETMYSGDNTTFWVEIPEISNVTSNTIYIYYGNDDATTASNGTATFIFFDDFETYSLGALNGQGGWVTGVVQPIVVNTHATSGTQSIQQDVEAGGGGNINVAIPDGFAMRWGMWGNEKRRVHLIAQDVGNNREFGILFGKNGRPVQYWKDGSIFATGTTYVENRWYEVEVRTTGSGGTQQILLDDVVIKTDTSSTHNPLTNLYIGMGLDSGGSDQARWDEILIRKYVSPGPSYGDWGSEEGWTNDTWTSMTGTENWSNVTKVVSSTVGATIKWKIYSNDTSNNWNTSEEFSFVTTDETPPQITILSPSNTTYPNNTIWFNVTLNEAGNVSLVEISGTNHTLTNSTGNWNYLNDTLTDGTYTTTFYCNDTAGNMNGTEDVTFSVDTTKPNIELNAPANNTNTTNNWILFNFTVTDNVASSLNCSLYINGSSNATNSSTANNTPTTFNITGIAEGSYQWNVTCKDGALNSNTSSTRSFTIDMSPPTFNVMTLNPSSEGDIDPNVQINITANVTDAVAVDMVIFQYKQDGLITWTNDTMDYNSGTGLYENASFTSSLPGTWNYRIWSNDTLGNGDIYNQTNLSIQYEYTWTRSPATFGVVSGVITTTSDVGVLTINNTGDDALSFDLSSNWGNIFYNVSEPFDLAAKGVKVINITATFSGAAREDDITITIDATSANADPSDLTTNATLASYVGGPYFDVSIVTYSAVVSQSQSGISLISKLKNIGNETATNTWLNWALPTGWTNTSGNLTQNISNLTAGSTAWNNLTVTIDPETASATTVTINVDASSAENITDSYSESVTVICNGTDGVCGLGCIVTTDIDCQAATPTTPSGGGGSRAPLPTPKQKEKLFQTQETYELVRGREQNFTLKVENQLGGILENVEVSISGFLAQYLRMEPKFVKTIAINRSFDFTIWIEAPKYFTRGEHNLNFTITGRLNKTRIIENITRTSITHIKESRLVTLIIYEVSREEAESYLNESVKLIEEMKKDELNTEEVETLLSKARDNFNNKNYEEVEILCESIKEKKEEAFETLSLLEDLNKMLEEADYNGLGLPKTGRVVLLSKSALERGDYELALKRADDARTTYALEIVGKFNLIAFIRNNWPEVSVATIGSSIGLWLAIFCIRFNLIKGRVKKLKKEEGILIGLIKEVQKECFEKGKLSVKEYMETLIQYEKRLSQVIQESIKSQTKMAHLFKIFRKDDKRLLEEKKKLLNLMKETQKLYLEAGKLETRIYQNRMRSYAERLAEIEERLAILEAKKVVKKGKFNVLVNKMKSMFR